MSENTIWRRSSLKTESNGKVSQHSGSRALLREVLGPSLCLVILASQNIHGCDSFMSFGDRKKNVCFLSLKVKSE